VDSLATPADGLALGAVSMVGATGANGGREDRRVRRTRRLLREALLALIVEKGYDRVTVQDVLDRADLSRATFYAHFRDKDDLLVSGFEELENALRRAMAAYAASERRPSHEALGSLRPVFEHVAEHRRLYRGLVGSRAGAVLVKHVRERFTAMAREHFQEVIASRRSVPAVPVEMMAQHTAGALLGVLTWWLDHDPPYSAEQIATMLERLLAPAIETGLGLVPQTEGRWHRE
jgi:AcrR family transcriptional regulator